jgi:hypothetical protein
MSSLRHRVDGSVRALVACSRCRRLDISCYLPAGSRACTCCSRLKLRCHAPRNPDAITRRFRDRLHALRSAASDILVCLDSVDITDAGISLSVVDNGSIS